MLRSLVGSEMCIRDRGIAAGRIQHAAQIYAGTPEAAALLLMCSSAEFGGEANAYALIQDGLRVHSPRAAWRVMVDTRSKGTRGNARFALERVRDELCFAGATVRIILVTNEYHMERARFLFEWVASDVFGAGSRWYIECSACPNEPAEECEKYLKVARATERRQKRELFDANQKKGSGVSLWCGTFFQ
eukprot:TRINITY_DN45484_c0_g1_i2.p1 TRINITY_DN45484_c0_g1~~TRINITY_DN45484_c0_g1_i2.p1  ORF type:complete len:217 (-),score=58.41 TRINITY_DN45484_c0_g1_i2:27-593(-)